MSRYYIPPADKKLNCFETVEIDIRQRNDRAVMELVFFSKRDEVVRIEVPLSLVARLPAIMEKNLLTVAGVAE